MIYRCFNLHKKRLKGSYSAVHSNASTILHLIGRSKLAFKNIESLKLPHCGAATALPFQRLTPLDL